MATENKRTAIRGGNWQGPQLGLAAANCAEEMYALASELHASVVGRSSRGRECLCHGRQ